ncbi:unnamed protein product [Candidula unifasciata]|uniref:Transmembrane protein 183A n=1 Tax=Candidula unifasciata TaxID=100452 RepID=A0A8S3Z3A0_9EUPU|nr:unnamed protein product [Candidula unifasciata]
MARTDEDNNDHQPTKNRMPKDGRKGRKKQGYLSISDITLHDFADCRRPQACSRVKKSIASAAAGAIPKTSSVQTVLSTADDDLSWFEKDLENFVIEDETHEDDEDLTAISSNVSAKGQKQKEKITSSDGVVYPHDLWFLVSDYIHPEDIGRFSGICRGAYSITLTAAFWRRLYERFGVKGKDKLPEHLRPHSMERLHGLRARVIRSLFYLSPVLMSRVHNRGPMEDEPHCLKGHRCLLAWHQPATKGWQFCFKFQKPTLQSLTSQRPVSKLDVYHGYNDLLYNPEAGCSVLQVTCCHFASVAAVMGLLLNQVYVTLSTGFRHHRLRLHFDSSISQNASDTVVVLDDVLSIKLMRWWHPGYPFTG